MADTLVLAAPGSVIADFKGAQSTVEPVVFDLPTDTVDSPAPWKEAVALKQAQCRASIPQEWLIPSSTLASVDLSLTSTTDLVQANIVRECGILSERELNITENFNARQLLARMARGEMSSLEVTVAFSKRAAIAQQLLSCLTETFFERAQERARFLDGYLQKEGKTYGPLHGLPISLKDSFKLVGIQATIGYVSFLGHPVPTENSALVDVLLRLGAVLYVKTNIPQTLMTADSENNIFGRTRNPRKLNLTAGGSSGGEGALVAFRGSVLGVGTDIAGSIRIPSLCCGVYGFKPTTQRVPYGRQATPSPPGLPGISAAAGPLAWSIGDLKVFFRAVLDAKPWMDDSSCFAVPYQALDDGFLNEASLVIGVLPEDPSVPLHPPVRRALQNAVSALEAAGHKIVRLPQDTHTSALGASELAFKFFAIDENNTGIQHILDSGEPMINTVAAKPSAHMGPSPKTRLSVADVAKMNVERMGFQEGWRSTFLKHRLDVVIGPGAQHTAPKHDTYGPPVYTTIWNLLDYPACIIPYGNASMALDPEDSTSKAISNPEYDACAFDGAPTAIQVVTPRFQDELCLRAAEIIDGVLQRSLEI